MPNNYKSWKAFDFGPEQKNSSKKAIISKEKTFEISEFHEHKRKPLQKTCYRESTVDFFSELIPKEVSDLAVHPKKIEEVKKWLEVTFSPFKKQTNTPFLLLSGPTGAGKMTTLKVLCKSMNVSISEWVNPIDQDFELVRGPNQCNRFLEYLTTESKYVSLLESNSEKKIVVVKDFPNTFLRNNSEFFNILDECYFKSVFPIVFICTEASSNKTDLAYTLFPAEILNKYQISHISFNACASSLLKICLKRAHELVSKNRSLFQVPSPQVIEAIISSSMGDIRCAVNQYYFASLLGTKEIPLEIKSCEVTGTKRKRSNRLVTIKMMGKDETLGLFHALGRIFNPKWLNSNDSKPKRLACDLESLLVELESQPETLINFLFTNFIKYFGDLREIQQASDLLCLSLKFFSKWTESKELHQYPLWISVLGLMTINKHTVSKWNQIEGPKKLKNNIRRNQDTVSSIDEYYINIIMKGNK